MPLKFLLCLFFSETEWYYIHTAIRCHTGIVGKIQQLYSDKSCDNPHIDDQKYWEIELKPPQDVIPMKNDGLEEELDLVSYKLISMLNVYFRLS